MTHKEKGKEPFVDRVRQTEIGAKCDSLQALS